MRSSTPISFPSRPKFAGQVKKVHVKNNQAVKAGDLLLEIDPRDLAVQLDQKRAAVESARANVALSRPWSS